MQIFEAFTVAVPNAAAPRGWFMIRPTLNIGLTHTPLLLHGPTVQMVWTYFNIRMFHVSICTEYPLYNMQSHFKMDV
jgi:hypothetical protein